MAINFKNISKSYGDHLVLDNINTSFKEGQTTVIVGAHLVVANQRFLDA